jgi:hypothetical protein
VTGRQRQSRFLPSRLGLCGFAAAETERDREAAAEPLLPFAATEQRRAPLSNQRKEGGAMYELHLRYLEARRVREAEPPAAAEVALRARTAGA